MVRSRYAAWLLLCLLAATPCASQEGRARFKVGLMIGSDLEDRLGDEIYSMVTDAFVASRRFLMVERRDLEAIFTEKDLKRFLGEGSPSLSGVLGMDLLGLVVYGVETQREEGLEIVARVSIEVRLVDVATGLIVETVTSERPYSPPARTPREARNYLSESLREKFPLTGYVVRVNGKEVIVDMGSEDGLRDGSALEVVREGESIFHPVKKVPLPAEWIVTGELKVVFVSPKLSTCWLRWGEEVREGSKVFLKEEFSPFSPLIQKKPMGSESIPESKRKRSRNHALDWIRRIFTRRLGPSCGATGDASFL